MSERSELGAIFYASVPGADRARFFTHSFMNQQKFDRLHTSCPVCGLYYEVEVGLFWGAMYISYGFSVGIRLAVGVMLFYLANDPPVWVYLTVVAAIIILSTTILFRYARILMLYFFSDIKYNPGLRKRQHDF